MIHLIINKYSNQNTVTIELRNDKLEKLTIRTSACEFNVGDYVMVETINKKVQISSQVNKPQNFLDFYEHGIYSNTELKLQLADFIEEIKNENYQLILNETINKDDDYYLFPAAKSIHHAYIGGLCEHTINMLHLARQFSNQYNLNRDLLYMGVILHDYGKLLELADYGLTYSLVGNLIGHITICVEKIAIIANYYEINDKNDIIALKHLVLSHHGKLEYGSPKEPMMLEAYVLSVIDDADAKIKLLQNVLEGQPVGQLSLPQMAMDRRRFVKL